MNKWVKSIIVALVLTGIVLIICLKSLVPHASSTYSVHYLLGSHTPLKTTRDVLGETPAIIKRKITELGYESVISSPGSNRLEIFVVNVKDTSAVRKVIDNNVATRKLEFRELYTLGELPGFFTAADKAADKLMASLKRKEVGIYSIVSPLVEQEIDGVDVFPAAIASVNKKDTAVLRQILKESVVTKAIPPDVQFYFGYLTDQQQITNMPDELHLYAVKTRGQQALLQNNDILRAEGHGMSIDISFDNNGARKLAALTGNNLSRYLAIILDDLVITTPRVLSVINGGQLTLAGRFLDNTDPETLAGQLTTNRLPEGYGIIKAEISSKSSYDTGKIVLILVVCFITSGGLAWVVFNSLKNS